MESREGLKFYRISSKYIKFLQSIDSRIMNNRNDNQHRVYIGVVLEINSHKYFAPLTSYKEEKHSKIKNNNQTCFIISDRLKKENRIEKLAVLNLNNMFPVIPTELEYVNFEDEEKKYQVLLRKEYEIIRQNSEDIMKRAQKLYKLRTEKNISKINNICCDFLKLEKEYIYFNKSNNHSQLVIREIPIQYAI